MKASDIFYEQHFPFEKHAQPLKSDWARARTVFDQIVSDKNHQLTAILDSLEERRDLQEMRRAAAEMSSPLSDIIFIGIGGSSLAPAIFSPFAKEGTRFHFWDMPDPAAAQSLFAQCTPSQTHIVAISRSGATAETCAMAAFAKEWLGKDAASATALCAPQDSPLRALAQSSRWRILDAPASLDSRFTIFSNVGMFPALLMGLDPAPLRDAAKALVQQKREEVQKGALFLFSETSKPIHALMSHGERLNPLALWWRQIWGESLARDGKGLTPLVARTPPDQHSQFQLYLDGPDDKSFTQLVMKEKGSGALSDMMLSQQEVAFRGLEKARRPLRRITLQKTPAAFAAIAMHAMLETFLFAALMKQSPFGQDKVDIQKQELLQTLAANKSSKGQSSKKKALPKTLQKG